MEGLSRETKIFFLISALSHVKDHEAQITSDSLWTYKPEKARSAIFKPSVQLRRNVEVIVPLYQDFILLYLRFSENAWSSFFQMDKTVWRILED